MLTGTTCSVGLVLPGAVSMVMLPLAGPAANPGFTDTIRFWEPTWLTVMGPVCVELNLIGLFPVNTEITCVGGVSPAWKWKDSALGAPDNNGSELTVSVTWTVNGVSIPAKVMVTVPLTGLLFKPDGLAWIVRLAGVAPCMGLTESHPPVETAFAVKLTGALGPATETLRATGVVLPCVAVKEMVLGVTAGGALTTNVRGTCGLFDAPGELMEIKHE